MRCLVCDTTDQWKNVDEFRIKPSGMCMCGNCGFVSYPKKYKTPEEIKAYYLKEYRKNTAPSIMNVYTGQRKLHYHAHFLKDLISDWKKQGFESPVICEVGAAFGMVLNWFKKQCFNSPVLYGTEWDLAMRRNSYYEWGIALDEDFDPSRKYDLIMSYKVAEHMLDADKHLRSYAESLTERGRVYISVPVWFETMNNFGKQGFDLEYYYHPDHINVWTTKLFEEVLRKAGLEVIKFNNTFYDNTYLCKRNDSLMSSPAKYEDPKLILEKLKLVFEANRAGMDGDYDKAVQIYPNFPYAWEGKYEKNRSKAHAHGFDFIFKNYIEPALAACPNTAETRIVAGDICMRYEKYDKAIELLELSLSMKPENPDALKRISQCFREMANRTKDLGEQLKLREESRSVVRYLRDISKQDEAEAVSWIYHDNARIPTPHEQANSATNPSRVSRAETVSGQRGEADNRSGPQP